MPKVDSKKSLNNLNKNNKNSTISTRYNLDSFAKNNWQYDYQPEITVSDGKVLLNANGNIIIQNLNINENNESNHIKCDNVNEDYNFKKVLSNVDLLKDRHDIIKDSFDNTKEDTNYLKNINNLINSNNPMNNTYNYNFYNSNPNMSNKTNLSYNNLSDKVY